MIKVEKLVVKAPSIGQMTLVGYVNSTWPMKRGNCFSVMDVVLAAESRSVMEEIEHRTIGRVINIRAEDFRHLIENYPDLVSNLEVEVISIDPKYKYVFVIDERLKDWLIDDICSVCIPLSIRNYLENQKGKKE